MAGWGLGPAVGQENEGFDWLQGSGGGNLMGVDSEVRFR